MPVAQKPRRVPFALRDKVRAHVDDLLEKDIIEHVDGPSSWVSPVVIAPKPGSDNIRLCVDTRQANTTAPVAVTIRDIERASAQDSELSQVHSAIQSHNLKDLPAPFKMVRTELTNVGFVILRGARIVQPQSLRGDIINLAHEGHQGIVKTKERLRPKIWWPGIDADAERKCRSCHGCQVVSQTAPTQPPVKPTPLPQGSWEHLAADLLGPLPTGEFLLVTVDYYSRYFEVDVLRSTTSKA